MVGVFKRGSVLAAQRSIDAVAMAFLGEEELLALSNTGPDSLELRLERTVPATAGTEVAWRKRFGALVAPQLFVDRARRTWTVTGSDGDDETVVVLNGIVGSDSVRMQRSTRATAIGSPLAAFADGSTLFLSLHQMEGSPAGGAWISALGSMSMVWELRRMRGGNADIVGTVRGYLVCEPTLSSDAAQCVERGSRRTRLLRIAANGTIDALATLPASFDLFSSDGDGLTIGSRSGARVVAIDTGTRRATELMIPAPVVAEPHRWLVDLGSTKDYAATLTSAVGSGHLTLFRVR